MRFIKKIESYAGGHSAKTNETLSSDKFYRDIHSYDKSVRSTHGVNCTGSCSWEIFVKDGFVVREMQQVDYPETRPDLPNHEPRGCPRGASYSWYLYNGNRVKYPMIRASLLKTWREAKEKHPDPVDAWMSIINDKTKMGYKSERGRGGLVRVKWNEAQEIIVASNIATIKKYGPDRIFGFSPIPAMSMLSYAAGSRYISLIGGVSMSFYDWYCDLPPSSPQTWGEQTDVPESAAWFDSMYIIAWGSNVPQTRTPDAHFLTEVRYKGTKVVAVTPDYSEVSKFSDVWLNPKFGTDAAMSVAMVHVILKEFYFKKESPFFLEYAKKYTDLSFLVKLEKKDNSYVAGHFLLAGDLKDKLGEKENVDWKPVLINDKTNKLMAPKGSIGHRWQEEKGNWTLDIEERGVLTLNEKTKVNVLYPDFSKEVKGIYSASVPVKEVETSEGTVYVATVFDLLAGSMNLSKDNANVDTYNDENLVSSPAWQEKITGVPREKVIIIATEFADNAEKTEGKSMVIIGAGINHWFNTDMTYRSIMYMLMLTGCIGQVGGGWAHYVGQEKVRPLAGWSNVAFGLDWIRPPRQINSTSFFYSHSDQWRYEKVRPTDLLSPLADKEVWKNRSLLDCNVLSERLGWLPSAPHFDQSTLALCAEAKAKNVDIKQHIVSKLKDGSLHFASERVDEEQNGPKNLFIWRSNLLGSSGKGHEYILKHLLGTAAGNISEDQVGGGNIPHENVEIKKDAPIGKLDLLVTLDFRMSTTCVYSDIVLPSATWYEKEDISTSDMHPFIHPFTKAVEPCWESKSDWDIYKGFAKKFSELVNGHLDGAEDVVAVPLLHDSAAEISQAGGKVKDWKKGEVEPIPGKTMPNLVPVTRDYRNIYDRFTSVGPLMDKLGTAVKGMSWDTKEEVEYLRGVNHVKKVGDLMLPKMETVLEAINAVLAMAPETNGHVAKKAWQSLEKSTGGNYEHIYEHKADERIKYKELQGHPKKIISSPVWSGLESEKVSYTAGYTNVHENIPWRTLTGRQQFYIDHQWCMDFGNGLANYKTPINYQNVDKILKTIKPGEKYLHNTLATPHQKWGIHSTYSENLIMLTLSRGGTSVWMNEEEASEVGIKDNDWVEIANDNGLVVARAIVSQRIPKKIIFYYHAQEKTINNPLNPRDKTQRGGIHNSLTKAIINPMHMIGGYAQFSYFFNYYGTIGSNREESVIIRKLDKVDWE